MDYFWVRFTRLSLSKNYLFVLILHNIIDTENLYFKLDSEVCAKYGKEFNKVIKQKIMGTTELRSAEMIIKELNLPVTPPEYLKQLKALVAQKLALDGVALMPGKR